MQAEMKGSPATAAIFEALHANRATAKERHAEMERKIRQVGKSLSNAYTSPCQLFQITIQLPAS